MFPRPSLSRINVDTGIDSGLSLYGKFINFPPMASKAHFKPILMPAYGSFKVSAPLMPLDYMAANQPVCVATLVPCPQVPDYLRFSNDPTAMPPLQNSFDKYNDITEELLHRSLTNNYDTRQQDWETRVSWHRPAFWLDVIYLYRIIFKGNFAQSTELW
ncbi:hypothetical protein CBL_11075 [Carabus blaptoides fortunei]